MFAILLLAQVAAATPAPAPMLLGTASSSVSAKPKTLTDLARERKLGKKAAGGGTLSVSGASGMPVVPAGTGESTRDVRAPNGSARAKSAQADVLAARRAVDEAASKKGMTSEDAAVARQKLMAAQRALSEAREDASRSGP